MYELDDVAALMKSVMDDSDHVGLRSEHPVAFAHYDIDGWLNQRLSAAGSGCGDVSDAGHGDALDEGCISLRGSSGRLFDEADAVQASVAQAHYDEKHFLFISEMLRKASPRVIKDKS